MCQPPSSHGCRPREEIHVVLDVPLPSQPVPCTAMRASLNPPATSTGTAGPGKESEIFPWSSIQNCSPQPACRTLDLSFLSALLHLLHLSSSHSQANATQHYTTVLKASRWRPLATVLMARTKVSMSHCLFYMERGPQGEMLQGMDPKAPASSPDAP